MRGVIKHIRVSSIRRRRWYAGQCSVILFCFLVIDESLPFPKENINFHKLIRENLLLTSSIMCIFRYSRFFVKYFFASFNFQVWMYPKERKFTALHNVVVQQRRFSPCSHHFPCLSTLEPRFDFFPKLYKRLSQSATVVKCVDLLRNLSGHLTVPWPWNISRRNKSSLWTKQFSSTRVQIRFLKIQSRKREELRLKISTVCEKLSSDCKYCNPWSKCGFPAAADD